jgi:hypothetical protein
MRRVLLAIGLVIALVVPAAALAASLDESKFTTLFEYGNDKCKDIGYDDGAYFYFVNNQTLEWQDPEGDNPKNGGMLRAKIDGAWTGFSYPAIVFNKFNQHFEVYVADGSAISDAETNLAGKLVLSHVTCKGSNVEYEG